MTQYYDGGTLDGGDFNDYQTGVTIDGGSFADPDISALEKMRSFVASFPYADILGDLAIDYTDQIANMGGIFPAGLVEVQRFYDLLGNVTCQNQYNFALYTVMEKAPGEDAGATYNAEWLMSFQEWVQERSVHGFAPTFGDEPLSESITAQNGAIYSAEDEGTAVYAIQLSVTFVKRFEKEW